MTEEIRKQVEQARADAEAEIGFQVSDEFAEDILELCERKCVCAGKGEDYLPIMYRLELPMKVTAAALNEMSRQIQKQVNEVEDYVRNLSPVPVRSAMPQRA